MERTIVLPRSGRRVRVLRGGAGPPVVLLHGLGGMADEILAPLSFLAEGHDVIAVDRPGYGGSDLLPAMDGWTQAAWLEEVLDHLEIPAVTLLAHSIAAAPALCFADSHPDRLSALVLVNPYCRPTRPAFMPVLRLAVAPLVGSLVRRALPRVAQWIAPMRLQQAFAPDPVPPHARELPFDRMAQPSAILAMSAELNAYNAVMMRMALRLRRLSVRTAVIAGSRDPVAPWRRHAGWLSRRLPTRLFLRLPNTGHMAHHVRAGMVAAALESAGAARPSLDPGQEAVR
jgi:pimeloyl-ACP methyl ester carboxylesterase